MVYHVLDSVAVSYLGYKYLGISVLRCLQKKYFRLGCFIKRIIFHSSSQFQKCWAMLWQEHYILLRCGSWYREPSHRRWDFDQWNGFGILQLGSSPWICLQNCFGRWSCHQLQWGNRKCLWNSKNSWWKIFCIGKVRKQLHFWGVWS